jgi:5-methylthioadenosine/S-adenosylhomocysteine deaminase
MHLHETAGEVQDCLATRGERPLAWLARHGLLRPGFNAIHMNVIDDADIELAARAGISITACPQSNLRLASGVAPLARFANAGLTLALGTDGPASVGALDMLAEARLAALLSAGNNSTSLRSSHDYLRLATLGGATALGLSDDIGTLRVGKAADFCCIELPSHATVDALSIADTLLYDCARHDVNDVWIGGRAALLQRQLCLLDEQDCLERARTWRARLATGLAA